MKLRVEFDVSVGLCQRMLAHHLSEGRDPPKNERELRVIISEYLRLDGFNVQNTLWTVDQRHIGRAVRVMRGLTPTRIQVPQKTMADFYVREQAE